MYLKLRKILPILILSLVFFYWAQAAGLVGSGTPESCTEAALDGGLAEAMAVQGIVTFDCGAAPHTITITNPKLITQSITIDGGNLITLSGGGTTTVLELNDNLPLLTLQNITIADGYATPAGPIGVCGGNACGGGVRGHFKASLTVTNSKFINNRAVATALKSLVNLDYGGGAIYMHTGTLNVTNSQFLNNQTTNSAGGAIHLLHSNAFITDSLFDGNQSNFYAGALYSDGTINDGAGITSDGVLQFTRNIFTNNTGRGQGGAVFNYLYINRQPNIKVVFDRNRFIGNSVTTDLYGHAYGGALRVGNGPAQIYDTTFSGNTAARQGGALWTGERAKVSIWNSTFSGNTATGTGPTDGFGGAIYSANSGGFSITNATIVNNQAGELGGGIGGQQTNLTLANTILANNTANNIWGMSQNCNRTYANGGGNLQSPRLDPDDTTCASGIFFANPLIGPLADNGGFAQTHALLIGSPAIDRGQNSPCPVRDQRGELRNMDGDWSGASNCDSGAYEYRGFDSTPAANAVPHRNFFETNTPTLTWNRISWAAGYAIQVGTRTDFIPDSIFYTDDAVAHDAFTATTSSLQEGVYYWRLRAKREDGTWGAWGSPDSFLIKIP